MKRVNHLLEKIADPENLRWAFWKARKGKSYSREVSPFRDDLERNLLLLRQQILSGLVEVGQYRFFKIFDPKERQICASAFREQVLHHALMVVCHDHFERVQIYDSYACRRGKGTYAALARAHPERLFNPFRVGAVMGYRTQGDYPWLGYATPLGYLGKFTLKGLNNLAQGNHPLGLPTSFLL